jgi:hypothetical protein
MSTVLVAPPVHPLAPVTLEEAGLSVDLMQQLALKTLYFGGELSGSDLAQRLGLRFGVFERSLDSMKQQRLLEVSGGSMFGGESFRYRITDSGRARALLALERSQYVGIAPVPLDAYRRYMRAHHSAAPQMVGRDRVRAAFSHLVVSETIVDQVGPAVSSGHSILIYGSPGNGKTVLAQSMRELLDGDIAIPHAIEVEGHIVRLFDPINHEQRPTDHRPDGLTVDVRLDERWVRCRRPLVITGGELTLDALELRHSPAGGFYRAPVQMVANGGVLVIDDFGRQAFSPRDLLNRWIVPLESRVDYLTLQSGQAFNVPFHVLLVMATNLKPTELVDEAFFRRIQYKIFAASPTAADFARIFERYCHSRGVPFDPAVLHHMLDSYYRPHHVPLRSCQPRDLINHALALADYLGQPRRLTPELMDAACQAYFVRETEEPDAYA